MKRFLSNKLVLAATAAMSNVALAQEATGGSNSAGYVVIGSALAIGLAAIGATSGQGKAAAAALEGIARNPGSRGDVFVPLILCLAFIEFPALLGFLIAFLWYQK